MPKNNAPANYVCPICIGLSGNVSEATLIRPADIVFRDELVTVLVNSFFLDTNPGHVIVVPNKHFENLYELPNEYAHRIGEVIREIALAMKQAYKCDGITTRQNNEPAGDQHAFHYHHHVIPRYINDRFNEVNHAAQKRVAEPQKRAEYATKLRKTLGARASV